MDFLARYGSRFELYGTAMRKCKFCGKIDNKITVCKRCCSAFYCNAECAANDWYQGGTERHQLHCKRIKARREMYIKRVMKEAKEKIDQLEEEQGRNTI